MPKINSRKLRSLEQTAILESQLEAARVKREQEQSSAPHPVNLPPTSPYPQIEPGKIEYIPEYRRVVYEETRSIWSDGSVTNIVRSNAKGNI